MMDIEKLIEQLRYLADTPSYTAFHDAKEREIICDQCEADFCYDKQQDAHWCMYEALSRAATALSTLQAENEKLRAELGQMKRDRDSIEQDFRAFAKQWWEEDSGFPCRWCKFENSGGCEWKVKQPNEGKICAGRAFEWRGQKEG